MKSNPSTSMQREPSIGTAALAKSSACPQPELLLLLFVAVLFAVVLFVLKLFVLVLFAVVLFAKVLLLLFAAVLLLLLAAVPAVYSVNAVHTGMYSVLSKYSSVVLLQPYDDCRVGMTYVVSQEYADTVHSKLYNCEQHTCKIPTCTAV
jgi:hypothetical protein